MLWWWCVRLLMVVVIGKKLQVAQHNYYCFFEVLHGQRTDEQITVAFQCAPPSLLEQQNSGSGSSEKQQQQKLTVINYTCYACLEMLEHAPYVGGPTSFVTIFIGYLQQEPQHLWSKRLCLRIHALKIWIKIFMHWGSHLTEVLYTGTATHSAKVKLARPTLHIDDVYTPNSHKRQPKQQKIKTKLQQQRKNERKRSERSQ